MCNKCLACDGKIVITNYKRDGTQYARCDKCYAHYTRGCKQTQWENVRPRSKLVCPTCEALLAMTGSRTHAAFYECDNGHRFTRKTGTVQLLDYVLEHGTYPQKGTRKRKVPETHSQQCKCGGWLRITSSAKREKHVRAQCNDCGQRWVKREGVGEWAEPKVALRCPTCDLELLRYSNTQATATTPQYGRYRCANDHKFTKVGNKELVPYSPPVAAKKQGDVYATKAAKNAAAGVTGGVAPSSTAKPATVQRTQQKPAPKPKVAPIKISNAGLLDDLNEKRRLAQGDLW